MAFETTGQKAFRTALLAETAINLTSVIPMMLGPETVLSYLAQSPSEITPLSQSLVQWIGATLTLATAPLLLSYPNPNNANDGAERAAVVARRRITYSIMGIAEIAIAGTTAWQYVKGGSGMKDSALLVATAAVGGFGLVRGWILFAKADCMEPPGGGERKTR